MKNSISKYLIAGVVGLIIAGLNLAAQAQSSIQGSIDFDGGALLDNPLGSATAFNSFYGPVNLDPVVQQYSQLGDYSSVPAGTPAVFTPFSFASGAGPLSVSPFWTFTIGSTIYNFNINSITSVSQNANFLNIMGAGTAQITGFSDTPGTWTITSSSANPDVVNVTFSSSAYVVPEPTTAGCLLLGLGALVFIRRFKQNGRA